MKHDNLPRLAMGAAAELAELREWQKTAVRYLETGDWSFPDDAQGHGQEAELCDLVDQAHAHIDRRARDGQ